MLDHGCHPHTEELATEFVGEGTLTMVIHPASQRPPRGATRFRLRRIRVPEAEFTTYIIDNPTGPCVPRPNPTAAPLAEQAARPGPSLTTLRVTHRG